jgi:hypothetical protein
MLLQEVFSLSDKLQLQPDLVVLFLPLMELRARRSTLSGSYLVDASYFNERKNIKASSMA